ncbi:MAG: LITAF-like zinc ribbon domain-containing protein [Pyrinomonadaceae bacterium]
MFCQNCRQSNDSGQNYCRHCGAPLLQPSKQTNAPPQPPKPYGWASPSSPLHNVANGGNLQEPQKVEPLAPANYQPPPFAQASNSSIMPQHLRGYRCPRCGINAPPVVQKKISDGGWIVFVLMLIFCFPLFFIGLLMREERRVCPACLLQVG